MLTAHNKFHIDQYLIRDHLGNTRMVLNAEEQPQQSYPNCDFEDDHAAQRDLYYLNAENNLDAPPSGFNTSEGTGAKCQLIKNNEAPVGVGKLLKVMATDEVGVKLDYYIPTDAVDNTGSDPLQNLVESIIGILNNTGYSGAMHGGGTAVGGGFEHDATLNSLLYPQSASNPSPNTVKAYLNILFFDDAFNFVCEQSRYVQLSVMGSAQTVTLLGSSMIAAPANGYAYIYVSNESRNAVFIDNFQVVHRPGRIVEDVSYYPFGLVQAGISSSAVGITPNKYKYNGKEEQRQEFADGSGLEWLDYGARMYDNQLGRWVVIDRLSEIFNKQSPYSYTGNNPTNFIDVRGNYQYPAGKAGEQQAANYPRLTKYLSTQIQKDITSSPRIMAGLLKYSGNNLTPTEVNIATAWGSGPIIKIVDQPGKNAIGQEALIAKGALGWYDADNNTIEISAEIAKQLEDAGVEDIQAALYIIFSVINHETVHYGDYLDGKRQSSSDPSGFGGEPGVAFKSAVFETIHVKSDNPDWDGSIYIQQIDGNMQNAKANMKSHIEIGETDIIPEFIP